MADALVTYLIVSVAALWVLWSVLLPARVRRAIRRRIAGPERVAAAPARMPGCRRSDCPGCGRHG